MVQQAQPETQCLGFVLLLAMANGKANKEKKQKYTRQAAWLVCIDFFALAHLFKNRWCQVGCRRNRGFILCVPLYDVYTYLKYMIKRMPSSYNVCCWVGLLTSIPCPSAQLWYLELGVQGPLCRLLIFVALSSGL